MTTMLHKERQARGHELWTNLVAAREHLRWAEERVRAAEVAFGCFRTIEVAKAERSEA